MFAVTISPGTHPHDFFMSVYGPREIGNKTFKFVDLLKKKKLMILVKNIINI